MRQQVTPSTPYTSFMLRSLLEDSETTGINKQGLEFRHKTQQQQMSSTRISFCRCTCHTIPMQMTAKNMQIATSSTRVSSSFLTHCMMSFKTSPPTSKAGFIAPKIIKTMTTSKIPNPPCVSSRATCGRRMGSQAVSPAWLIQTQRQPQDAWVATNPQLSWTTHPAAMLFLH